MRTRIDELRARGDRLRDRALELPGAGLALAIAERDRRSAGSLLAGGLAFRLFMWFLPAALLLGGALGLAPETATGQATDYARDAGLGSFIVENVASAARQSTRSALALAAIGGTVLAWFSLGLARAIRLAHVLAWGLEVRRRPHVGRDAAATCVALAATAIGSGAVGLNEALPTLLAPFATAIIVAATWFGLSFLYPHAPCPWWALLPGAAVVGVGLLGVRAVTLVYLSERIGERSELYGSLGAAAVVLLWLYFLGRVLAIAPVVNAVLYERHIAPASADRA